MKNADNPRYSQDKEGQWWYTPSGPKIHQRTRAFVKTCSECGEEYVASTFHQKITKHCSRICGQRAWAREHPTHYMGERNRQWKGGRMVQRGYIWIWAPEEAQRLRPGTKKPYVLEHRLVMAKLLGRDLLPSETVHHKGVRYKDIRNRSDNLEDNLELRTGQHGNGITLICADCGSHNIQPA